MDSHGPKCDTERFPRHQFRSKPFKYDCTESNCNSLSYQPIGGVTDLSFSILRSIFILIYRFWTSANREGNAFHCDNRKSININWISLNLSSIAVPIRAN